MENHKEEIRSMKEDINTKIDEAIAKANEGNLEAAQAIQAEVEELKAGLEAKESELSELEKIINSEKLPVEEAPAEEVEVEEVEVEETPQVEEEEVEEREDEDEEELELRSLKTNKGDMETMANLNELNKTNEQVETRSAINAYIKSKGVETRGINTVDAGAVIPVEVITTPQETPQTVVDLRQHVNKVQVGTGSGSYPVLGAQNAVMSTVAELAANPELANPNFTDVDFKIETYRGAIAISQESLDDAAIDLASLVAKDIQKQALNTSNAKIAAVAKTFTAKSITDLDGLKTIVNTEIDPAYNTKFYVSQSFFNEIDKMKDLDGRYILSQDVTVASGAKLFGREVVILADNVIGSKAGDKVAFVGDMAHAVSYFDRSQVSVKWQDHAIYGQFLAAMLRFDTKKVDPKAGFYVTLAPVPAP